MTIFSHDFLKAFFGAGEDGWQHHGCQMLLSKDPIGYLGKFLETDTVKPKGKPVNSLKEAKRLSDKFICRRLFRKLFRK